jgi:hypothetical protein
MSGPATAKFRSREEPHPAAYTWFFPGAPVRITIDLDLIATLRSQIDARPANPFAGLLAGVSEGQNIHIKEVLPLAGSDRGAVGDAIRTASPSSGSHTIGYVIAEERDAIRLNEGDIQLVERYFREPDSVLLLIQLGQGEIPNASFFFWDNGRFLGDLAFLEFPFDPLALRTDAWRSAGPVTGASAAEAQAANVGHRLPSPTGIRPASTLSSVGLLFTFGGVFAIALLLKNRFRVFSALPSRTDGSDAGLDLRVERSGTDFRLTWNRRAVSVRQALAGMLCLEEGGVRREISLSPEILRNGSVVLETKSDYVQIGLYLSMPDQSVDSESVLLLLASPQRPVSAAAAPIGGLRP